MDSETEKIIAEQMKNIPEDVALAIISVEYQNKLKDIIKRQKLLIDQAGKLEFETTLVMIGLEPINDYTANIQRELALTTMRAKEIAMDVSENIFKPVRASLHSMDKSLKNPDDSTGPNDEVIDANEADLDRDQILNEIENPAIIDGGAQSMNFTKSKVEIAPETVVATQTTELEIRPEQVLEIIPGQVVKDITKEKIVSVLESKMTNTTVTPPQIIEAKPSIKLPEIKKRPSSGVDPYREPLI
jgi:hypothetical protein